MNQNHNDQKFRAASAKAIPNVRLQAAVRKTAGVLAQMRATTVATLPDFEALRSWGRSRKLEISDNLEEWAARFSHKVEELGGTVHRAKDATAAGQIIIEIALKKGVKIAVKSKSMTTEEIGLNQIMQDAGIEVTETDLGEFIIQLAGEHPSHILAPAIHRSQDEVRSLFAEKLGAPDNLDVEGMVRFARKVLRERFLEAGMGISGANFAVADTGTVAIVTNEGNGRMCTSLPPVHVALVGMEKIIPSLNHLPDFLSLLTCSATGQRASSYISMTTGPRRAGETEGPEELHIVLLDNGRTSIAASPWREIMHCLHCGACLNHCPVYKAVGGHAYESPYSGPMGSVLSSLIWGDTTYPDLASACTLCGRCAEVCAVKIPLPDYHRSLRNRSQTKRALSLLAAQTATRPSVYQYGISALRNVMRIKKVSMVLAISNKSAAAWLSCRELPVPKNEPSFRQWWQEKQETRLKTCILQGTDSDTTSGTDTNVPPMPTTTEPKNLFQLYCQRAAAIGVELAEITLAELSGKLLALLNEEAVASTAFPSNGWPEQLKQELLKILNDNNGHLATTEDNPGRNGWNMEELTAARLGITYCPAFLAETGSMVFAAGPGNGTLASLLPEVHLAISHPQGLRRNLQDYFTESPGPLPSRLTQITGPSRTGDIEGTMTVGVHGPRRVIHWILVAER